MQTTQTPLTPKADQRPVIESGGLVFQFARHGQGLVLETMTHRHRPLAVELAPEELNFCAEAQLHLTGHPLHFHTMGRNIGGCGHELICDGLQPCPCDQGRQWVIEYHHPTLGFSLRSFYHFPADDLPLVRRWTQLHNQGPEPLGVDYLASAIIHNLCQGGSQPWTRKLRLHFAWNHWAAEGQWQRRTPRQLGLHATSSGFYRLTQNASASASLLPMGMIEDTECAQTWLWQIEHSGAWAAELGENGYRHLRLGPYLQLGGPGEIDSPAWKQVQPGEVYRSIPVTIGCVEGGFEQAVQALTLYRRAALKPKHPADAQLPIIFNDYMNCLDGDPTLEAERPLIEAAARAGAEYYVIDAGWYARRAESWWDSVGAWEESPDRFGPDGLAGLMDLIRQAGMRPGLWLEPEVVGMRSPLAARPDDWFLCKHGRRLIINERHLLDLRNPAVRGHLDSVIDRLVLTYGLEYIKCDYNAHTYLGTDAAADSFQQGWREQVEALHQWYDGVRARHPRLIVENCASGGMRMDYGMLSRLQIQSSSDQTDYQCYPSILTGLTPACLPEQLAVWAYPLADGDEEQTIFNMVSSLLVRIHLSGQLASLNEESQRLVREALERYKIHRDCIARALPFYPLGHRALDERGCWHALGLRAAGRSLLAVWKLGCDQASVGIPLPRGLKVTSARCVYPQASAYQPDLKLNAESLEIKLAPTTCARLIELDHAEA